jgi:hypothetical protein
MNAIKRKRYPDLTVLAVHDPGTAGRSSAVSRSLSSSAG